MTCNSPDAAFSATSSETWAWTDGGAENSTPRIWADVLVYSTPLAAWLEYWLYPLEAAYPADWPNLQYHLEDRFPSDWPYARE